MTDPSQSLTPFSPQSSLPVLAQQATDYWIDAAQRTVLFWDVLRQRGDEYDRSSRPRPLPHVLSFDVELVLDGRTLRGRSTTCWCGSCRRKASRSTRTSVPSSWSTRAPATGPASAASRPTAKSAWRMQRRPSLLLRRLPPDPMPGQTIEDVMPRRGGLPREGHRAASRGRGQALRHRQLPGRLGGDDAGRRSGRSCSARSSSPVRRCPTGRACGARTRCATSAACWAAAG